MTIRKRNDGEGWKRGLGAFSGSGAGLREGRFPNSDPGTNKKGTGAYTSDEKVLTNKQPYEQANDSHDVYSNVEKNSGNGAPGPIKYGVD